MSLKLFSVCQDESIFKAAVDFLMPYEEFYVPLMENLLAKRETVYAICTSQKKILALINHSLGNSFSCCTGQNFQNAEIESFLKSYFKNKKIRCLTGRTQETSVIKKIMLEEKKALPVDERQMHLMRYRNKISPEPLNDENLKIIKCTIKNLEELIPLQYEFSLEEVEPKDGHTMLSTEKRITEYALNVYPYFALKKDDEFIAQARINALGKNYWQIGGVYTKKECRSKGYAKHVLKALVDFILSSNKNAVLYVRKNNPSAIACYTSCGFEILGDYDMSYFSM